MKIKRKLVAALIMLGIAGVSNASVVNFSDLSTPGNGFNNLGTSVTHDGFKFSSTDGGYGNMLGVWQNSAPNHPSGGDLSTSLAEYYAYSETTMTETNNSLFQLNAIDLAAWGTGYFGTFNVTFTGTKLGGSTVQQVFTVDNFSGSTPVLQHFIFSGFTDLEKVQFTQGIWTQSSVYQFNNLVANQAQVPEPDSILLFCTGVAGLVGIRVRRKKQGRKAHS